MTLKEQSVKRVRLNFFDDEVSHRIGEWKSFNLITSIIMSVTRPRDEIDVNYIKNLKTKITLNY
jgi:hypothetical protein